MKNVGFKFENLLADAGYSNELVIDYLQKSQIKGFIPNATQSREYKDALKLITLINLSFALQDMCIP